MQNVRLPYSYFDNVFSVIEDDKVTVQKGDILSALSLFMSERDIYEVTFAVCSKLS